MSILHPFEFYTRRRRALKTTIEQYNVYLHVLENDETFRRGSNAAYVENKWKELAQKLNRASHGYGPELTPSEWRKVRVKQGVTNPRAA